MAGQTFSHGFVPFFTLFFPYPERLHQFPVPIYTSPSFDFERPRHRTFDPISIGLNRVLDKNILPGYICQIPPSCFVPLSFSGFYAAPSYVSTSAICKLFRVAKAFIPIPKLLVKQLPRDLPAYCRVLSFFSCSGPPQNSLFCWRATGVFFSLPPLRGCPSLRILLAQTGGVLQFLKLIPSSDRPWRFKHKEPVPFSSGSL